MTYIPPARIEARTAELWLRHGLAPAFDVERLLDDLGLGLVWESVADNEEGRILGQLIPREKVVVLNERHVALLEEKGGRLRRYTLGHEVGHWVLHAGAARTGMLMLFEGDRTWCRDGSQDPLERQAEMFSASLLMPKAQLLASLPPAPWCGWPHVYRLADTFLVNVTPMAIRLERLGWMHRDDQGVPVSGPRRSSGQESLFS